MVIGEFRFEHSAQPLTGAWQQMPVAPHGATLLGLSFRPLQAAAFGLEPRAILPGLLAYPFPLIRLGAYWNQIEPSEGVFDTSTLDWQIDAAERAGKQIIVCLGPLKTFGYPEFFVPRHRLPRPFTEHTRILPGAYPALVAAASDYLARLVDRYKQRAAIVSWQLEHEAVDPLGVEHSWRLAASFVAQEMDALRRTDPSRPIVMNGFLPSSALVRLSQSWQTRDQGDSLAVAQRLADIVGIDYYPRHALVRLGARTLYLDGSRSRWAPRRAQTMAGWAAAHGKRLMVAEGQSEPWEAVTTPPNPSRQGAASCLPEHLIANYNAALRWLPPAAPLYAYLCWGAEYWLLRRQHGDTSYLGAFARLLENA
jgi:glycosyl hydrolase family 42 (putative beta-galactosidase)